MNADLPFFGSVLPELILAIGAMALLMLGVFSRHNSMKNVQAGAVILLIVAGIVLIIGIGGTRQIAFGGMFVTDAFSIFTKVIVLAASAATLVMGQRYLIDHKIEKFEYSVLIVLSALGMMLMISANDLLALYVGLELQSLALYVLAAMNRDRVRSTEAGLKYFVLGALSSGMLLYGISLIYGFSGTTSFDVLAEAFRSDSLQGIGLIVGMVFLLAGLAFKVSAVPFHMWTPDVYEGAPTPITTFFAAAPKMAAIALLVRVTHGALPGLVSEWQQIIIFISVASMLVGAVVALVQTNIKRLLAYSSIGNVGFALVGLAAGTAEGVEALLIYMAIYVTTTLGSFGIVLMMRREGTMVENISELSGLARNNLPAATAMAVFMFSLAGIPLLAGFFGKWFVFLAAVQAGLWPLAVVGVVTSVVGAFYYLRIVKLMFFDEPEPSFDIVEDKPLKAIVAVSALVNSPVSYFLLIAPLAAAAAWATQSLLF